jgi:hypothetical protein
MQDQDSYIRHSSNMPLKANLSQSGIRIEFYPTQWSKHLNSIFAMGYIICDLLCCNHDNPNDKLDVSFLEVPIHLNWYKAAISGKFYLEGQVSSRCWNWAYIQKSVAALTMAGGFDIFKLVKSVHAYCHKLIKLSP